MNREVGAVAQAWAALWTEYKRLHQVLVQIVGQDEMCRRLCRIPVIGPVAALSVKAAIGDPRRTVLYEAASAMLVRSEQWCTVKAWAVRIAAKRGHKRAVVAVARKLAVAGRQRVPIVCRR